ncbi:hypothetical protein O181_019077 [Austropuccinia psidii MF-1]|uniref:Integrase catalytic domain-containing protein n=1 Tax=Austropuccinia psidii MF-1 TaxID=1389203 RepID=A0A9Q3C912_9BASI|nr:hypothetical protein [Austropuccinia psidii MF-1]
MRSQSDFPSSLKDWIALIHVQCGVFPKPICMDNAKEFVSTALSQYMAANGIVLVPSLPYSPSENREAERLNRTLGNMARSMLLESRLPVKFWRFAYLMEAFIHNQPPNSRTGGRGAYTSPTTIIQTTPFIAFPDFNTAPSPQTGSNGGLSHLLNVALGEFPTEEIHLKQEQAAVNLPKSSDLSIPSNFQSAMKHPLNDKWKRACFVELEQLRKQHVYDLVDRSDEMKVIGHQWVFDLKRDADGTVNTFKARFCARGDSQRPGIDCGETYAPTASLLCLCLLLSVAKFGKWNLASFDISGAYFYSPIKEDIFVSPPLELDKQFNGKVFHLKKALYGIRQAGHCWWKFFSELLLNLGFVSNEIEPSFYLFRKGGDIIVIWIHVDNGVVASNSTLKLESFRIAIQSQSEVEWFPTIHKIVGLHCSIDNNEIQLSQPSLIQGILKSYNRPIVKHESTISTIDFVNQSQPTDSLTERKDSFRRQDYISLGHRMGTGETAANL